MVRSTVQQWRMFKALAEHGGFHQAAEVVFKSQSSVHNAVYKMEDSLGVRLVCVENRKTSLTPAGEQLLKSINLLLSEAEKMENIALNYQAGIELSIKVAIDYAFPKDILYDTLAAVSIEYPNTRVELMETVLSGADELLSTGKAEIAVSPFVYHLCEDICNVEFIAVASPTHPLNQLCTELTVEDLKCHRQIVLCDSGMRKNKESVRGGTEFRWTVNHISTSVDLILKGLGFAWLPKHLVQSYIESDQLRALPLAKGGLRSVMYYLNYNDGDKLGPVIRSFVGHLRYLSKREF